MDKDYLLLTRAALRRPSGEWNDDDFDVAADGAVVGRIFKANAAPVGSPRAYRLIILPWYSPVWHPPLLAALFLWAPQWIT